MMRNNKKILGIVGILIAWMALLISPIGYYVAGFSIIVLIVILFVCGCIEVQTAHKK
jgi:hypothetical protein